MLKFLKRDYSICAPVDGEVIDLSQVPDEIFSKSMAGEGVAIMPSDNIFVSPANGIVNSIFSTNHGFTIKMNNGINILVHIGLDTIELNGEGFDRLVNVGDTVKTGTPIIKVNETLIIEENYCFITPVVITNTDKAINIRFKVNCNVKNSSDKIIMYNLR